MGKDSLFNEQCCKNWRATCKKKKRKETELNPYLMSYIEVNSKLKT